MEFRVFSTFSGIGMQERGVSECRNLEYQNVGTCEVDKDAMLSFAAIHNNLTMEKVTSFIQKNEHKLNDDMYHKMAQELLNKKIGYDFIKDKQYDWHKLANRKDKTLITKYWLAMKLNKNVGDISGVKKIPPCDLLTFSFPCQDISLAGLQKGIEKGKTRSGLVYEVIRLLNQAKKDNQLPKYLIMENVKNLVGTKFIDKFKDLNKEFEDIGYNVYYQVINAKNCGVPQNRERVFGVYIRKDIDMKNFSFPEPFDTGIRLKHVLEKEIDSKYYLSQKIQDRFILTDKTFSKNIIGTTKPSCRKIGQRDIVYNTEKIMGTLVATDYKQPKQILLKKDNNCKQIGFLDIKGYFDVEKRVYNTENIYSTITTCPRSKIATNVDIKSVPHIKNTNLSVRKLTPIESFRLMGLTKKDALACYNIGESDSILYKQAGNGLVSNCITLLLEHLYKAQIDNNFICTDEKILANNLSRKF